MGQDVSVKIGTENSSLDTGLAQAKAAVEGFKEHASESFKELGGEMLAAFALTAVIESVKSLFEEFSHVQDLAEKLGTSAESVQRLGVVAKAAGVDTESLTKALQKGTKNAYEAATGNEELAKQFEALGIDAKDFQNLEPEEQLKELAEGFQKSGQNAQSYEAISKALGKTGLDLIPILRKGPQALAEEMDAAKVASNDTVATMKEVTEKFERLFANMKAYGAEALDFIIKRVEALGTGFAAITAYVSNLSHGLGAAKQAFNDVLDAAAELQVEEDKKREEQEKARKPVDSDAINEFKAQQEAKLKLEEELEKVKEANAKKEEEARFRNLELLQKQADLEKHIADLKNTTPSNELEAEQNKGKILDYQKELETVNKEISRDKEAEEKKVQEELAKDAKARASEALKEKKNALKQNEKELSDLERQRGQSVSVDSLRQVGGGFRGINYNANSQKDDLQRQQVEYLRKMDDKLQQAVDALEAQSKSDIVPSYDGTFN